MTINIRVKEDHQSSAAELLRSISNGLSWNMVTPNTFSLTGDPEEIIRTVHILGHKGLFITESNWMKPSLYLEGIVRDSPVSAPRSVELGFHVSANIQADITNHIAISESLADLLDHNPEIGGVVASAYWKTQVGLSIMRTVKECHNLLRELGITIGEMDGSIVNKTKLRQNWINELYNRLTLLIKQKF